jgi:uroporphyrinogen-III synthase
MANNEVRVLVTRPEPHSQITQTYLREQGWQVQGLPLIHIEPCSLPSSDALAQKLAAYDAIIALSPRAVDICASALDNDYIKNNAFNNHDFNDDGLNRSRWPQNTRYFAIGPTSASHWQTLDLAVHVPSDARSEGLLQLIERQGHAQSNLLILCGHDGRSWLTDKLQQMGATVECLYCYQRVPITISSTQLKQWSNGGVNAIVLSSGSLLETLHRQCQTLELTLWLRQCALLLPSQRVCQQAQALGYTNTWNCHGATDTLVHQTLSQIANCLKESQ